MYIAGFVSQWIWGIFLYIDGIIYDVVRWVYQIFNALAKLNLFDDNSYQQIVQRIYIILGVIMLFVLAYSLLKAVINPDDFAKGEASFPNLIKNVVISLVIIAVLPTVFTFAFNVQNAILNQETIPKLILNDTGQTDPNGNAIDAEYIRENGGGTIAYWTFRAFFNPKECEEGQNKTVSDPITGKTVMSMEGLDVCANAITVDKNWIEGILDWGGWPWNWLTSSNDPNLTMVNNEVYSGRSFTAYTAFSGAVDDAKISYIFPISTIVGIVLLLILLTYCIALALRVIKLAFYQIIAPIPVIMRVLPGDKKKVFDNWVKQIIGTFIDVFIRIGILYLGVYLIQMIINKFAMGTGTTSLDLLGPIQKLFAVAFLIVGVLMFVRSAPGLLKDLFGFDVGGSLNPFKIFQDATQAVAPAAALVGGATTGLTRNLIHRGQRNWENFRNAEGAWAKTRAAIGGIFGTLGSGIAGATSAGARGAYNARNAKSFSDISKATTDATKTADANRSRREKYIAEHGGRTGAMIGHVADAASNVALWATGGYGKFDDIIKKSEEYNKMFDSMKSEAESLRNKNSNDATIIPQHVEFKFADGDTRTENALNALWAQYGNGRASIATMEKMLNNMNNQDPVASIDRNDFYTTERQTDVRTGTTREVRRFDDEAYNRAVHDAQLRHAQATADMENFINQVKKATDYQIINSAIEGGDLGGISSSKLAGLGNKAREFNSKYERDGNSVVDPIQNVTRGAIGTPDSNGNVNMAKDMDDIVTAHSNQASEASAQKARFVERNNNQGN